ncbi:MAG: hypothetical protein H0V01_05785 [Bacteroidetes bacterium]|nr:hypothetical protein [Bacteroidota bacterium]HET6244340.1 hypothetical protein [Bacteroidia bacterium]
MKKKFTLFILFSIALIIFTSCKKEAGTGGKAIVKGKLYAGNYHSPEFIVSQEDVEPEERVFLVYDNEQDGFGDDIRTNHDGSFEFKYLRKGNYKIFAYGMDTSKVSSSPKTPVLRNFEISDKKQNVEINDLIIYQPANKGGSASIRGKIWVKNYNASFTELKGEYGAQDETVYLKCGNEVSYSERIRTSYDGSFEFKNLRKGKYEIYTYSKDSAQLSPSGTIMVKHKAEINSRDQILQLNNLVIFN